MIDVKELRIGNWVNYAHENLQVFSIYPGKITFATGNYSPDPRSIEPIPLTPEILVKCGFELEVITLEGTSVNVYKNMFDVVHLTSGKFIVATYISNTPAEIDIQHLHQLQNLYYSLTQTELKIEL